MLITVTREHTINMGNYESAKIGAAVTFDKEEAGNTAPAIFAAERIMEVLAPQVQLVLEQDPIDNSALRGMQTTPSHNE